MTSSIINSEIVKLEHHDIELDCTDLVVKTPRTFRAFIEQKKNEGVTLSDSLQRSFVKWMKADDIFGKIKHFIGAFLFHFTDTYKNHVIDQVDGSVTNIEDLDKETAFYKALVKTQKCYNAFHNKKPPQSLEKAQKAFEDLHKLSEEEDSTTINEILNKYVGGKDVAKELLEYSAESTLLRDGVLSTDSIRYFAIHHMTDSFMQEQASIGYGLVDDIKRVFTDTYDKVLNKNENDNYTIHNQIIEELQNNNFDKKDLNDRLLAMMKKGYVDQDLLQYVDTKKQNSLILMYKNYETLSELSSKTKSYEKQIEEVINKKYGVQNDKLEQFFQDREAPDDFEDFLEYKKSLKTSIDSQSKNSELKDRKIKTAQGEKEKNVKNNVEKLKILEEVQFAAINLKLVTAQQKFQTAKDKLENFKPLNSKDNIEQLKYKAGYYQLEYEKGLAYKELQQALVDYNNIQTEIEKQKAIIEQTEKEDEQTIQKATLEGDVLEEYWENIINDLKASQSYITGEQILKLFQNEMPHALDELVPEFSKAYKEAQEALKDQQKQEETAREVFTLEAQKLGFNLDNGTIQYRGFEEEDFANQVQETRSLAKQTLLNIILEKTDSVTKAQIKAMTEMGFRKEKSVIGMPDEEIQQAINDSAKKLEALHAEVNRRRVQKKEEEEKKV